MLGNGVDLGRFGVGRFEDPSACRAARRRVRSELGVGDDGVVVGAVGRLVLEKGYAELFEAWERVVAVEPRATLVVVGPSDDAKADAVSPGIIRRAEDAGVRFLGMRSDVQDVYLGLDLYVLASHREGFPRSAMEAAASGLPIVATNIRGCRQVVDHEVNGLLVEVSSPDELADALIRLVCDDSRRSDMSEAAAEKAVREFDQQRVIDRTLATYSRLLTARGIAVPTPTDA